MAKLPMISGKDAVKVFKKDGWAIQRRAKNYAHKRNIKKK